LPTNKNQLILAVRNATAVGAALIEMAIQLQLPESEVRLHIANLMEATRILAIGSGLTIQEFREAHGSKLLDLGRMLTSMDGETLPPAGLARVDQLLAALRDSIVDYTGRHQETTE
jgi:predicted ArsR family transcriptional regulator